MQLSKNNNFNKMSLDTMHSELIKHYRKNSITKQQKNIKKESIIKQSLIKKGYDN